MELFFQSPSLQTDIDLPEGTISIGGDAQDAITLPHWTPRSIFLTRQGENLVVRSAVCVALGKAILLPQADRLWLDGEVMQLGEDIRLTKKKPPTDDLNPKSMVLSMLRADPLLLHRYLPSLWCVMGADLGRHWIVGREKTSLGRSPSQSVALDDLRVSRRHATLMQVDHRYQLAGESLGSIRINGRTLTHPVFLAEGDLIELGRTVLYFRWPLGAQPAQELSPSLE